jgi:hypothetical protein
LPFILPFIDGRPKLGTVVSVREHGLNRHKSKFIAWEDIQRSKGITGAQS